jgi:hypothetical protein
MRRNLFQKSKKKRNKIISKITTTNKFKHYIYDKYSLLIDKQHHEWRFVEVERSFQSHYRPFQDELNVKDWKAKN